MGLRFRKSIRICKGVRVNFGKTGTSVSFGTRGMRYTVNSKGRETVSVGVPGTGLYYTETLDSNKKSNTVRRGIDSSSVSQSDREAVKEFIEHVNNIRKLHTDCGPALAWNKIATRNRPFDGEVGPGEREAVRRKESYEPTLLDKITGKAQKNLDSFDEEIIKAREKDQDSLEEWRVKKERAEAILGRDIDAYLKVIEETNPFEEVAEYGSEFEFGTDNADVMYVQFNSKGKQVVPSYALKLNERGRLSKRKLTKTEYYDILQDYISSCTIRIARELFAIIPISRVVISVEETIIDDITGEEWDDTVLSVQFSRIKLKSVPSFDTDPSDLIEEYSDEYHMNFLKTKGFKPVCAIDR